jgi:hypothetical protein
MTINEFPTCTPDSLAAYCIAYYLISSPTNNARDTLAEYADDELFDMICDELRDDDTQLSFPDMLAFDAARNSDRFSNLMLAAIARYREMIAAIP